MSIFYSESTKQKIVIVAKERIKRVRMAFVYGLNHGILDFTEVAI